MANSSSISPTVSIVLCTYNGERFLREQLDTILAQTYPIHELIISDDGSTDATPAILREYADRHPELIRLYTHTHAGHLNDNFFFALSKTTGELIAISDQDDIWMPNKIAAQVDALGDAWLCFHLSPIFRQDPDYHHRDTRIQNANLERFLFASCIPGHTILLRRSLLDILFEHVPETTFRRLSSTFYYDTILSMTALAFGQVRYLTDALTFHRAHAAAQTAAPLPGRQNLSERTIGNAIRLVLRNLSPQRRHILKPLIINRMQYKIEFLNCFPEAPAQYTRDAYRLAHAFMQTASWRRPIRHIIGSCCFLALLVRCRNRIFYAPEKNQLVATLRALLYPITMYDLFEADYQRLTHKKQPTP